MVRVPLLLCEKVCKICRSADVPTSEDAYRSVRTGVSPPHLECMPVPSLLLLLAAPITSHRLWRGRSLLALEALRPIVGVRMSTSVGEGTHWKAHLQLPPCSAHRFLT